MSKITPRTIKLLIPFKATKLDRKKNDFEEMCDDQNACAVLNLLTQLAKDSGEKRHGIEIFQLRNIFDEKNEISPENQIFYKYKIFSNTNISQNTA